MSQEKKEEEEVPALRLQEISGLLGITKKIKCYITIGEICC